MGIAFARTLHYQFYAWYISSVPFLLWSGALYPLPLRVLLLGALEYAFLTFPATPMSSMVLQAAHLAILLQIRPPKQMWEDAECVVDSGNSDKKNS